MKKPGSESKYDGYSDVDDRAEQKTHFIRDYSILGIGYYRLKTARFSRRTYAVQI